MGPEGAKEGGFVSFAVPKKAPGFSRLSKSSPGDGALGCKMATVLHPVNVHAEKKQALQNETSPKRSALQNTPTIEVPWTWERESRA